MKRGALVAVGLLAGCTPEMTSTVNSPGALEEPQQMPVDPAGIRPIRAIPVALRGCWQTDAPADPEEPGAAHRLVVTATTIEQQFPGQPPRVATAEFVERVSGTMIEGRYSAPALNGRATVATSLRLEDEKTLRRAEGDAGSDDYYRCP